MIYAIQHHPLEDLGLLAPALARRGLSFCSVHAPYEALPQLQTGDRVVLLGGPVNVADASHLAWLAREQQWLKQALTNGHSVLAICLGAQLLSNALGAAITPMANPELGWQSVQIANQWQATLGGERRVMQWHSYQFALPIGASHLAGNAACANQGYFWQQGAQHVLATQFHPEWHEQQLHTLLDDANGNAEQQIDRSAFASQASFAAQAALCDALLGIWLNG